MHQVAKEAIERARRGEGPTLIEAETYRFRGHSLADPDELRSKEEKAKWLARDPIPQLKKYMIDNVREELGAGVEAGGSGGGTRPEEGGKKAAAGA